ncbi:MAG: hypothetical protein ACRC0A_07745 [Chitinophagaceae bacterium]
MMIERIIETNKITTNETEFADKKFKLYDARRNGTRELIGVTLDETPIIFSYMGKDYFLINNNIVDEDHNIILSNYLYHYIKDGIIYITNIFYEVYVFTISSLFKTKFILWNTWNSQRNIFGWGAHTETGTSNIIKSNISFIAPNNEEIFYTKSGKCFILEQKNQELKARLFSDDGTLTNNYIELPPLPRNINRYDIYVLNSNEEIHLAFYERQTLYVTITIITPSSTKTIQTNMLRNYLYPSQYIFFGNNNKIIFIEGQQNKITAHVILDTGVIEKSQIIFFKANLNERVGNITKTIDNNTYNYIFTYNENKLNIATNILVNMDLNKGELGKEFKNIYISVAISYRLDKENNLTLSGLNTIENDIDYVKTIRTGTTFTEVYDRIPMNILIFLDSNNLTTVYHSSKPQTENLTWQKPNSDTTIIIETYPNYKYNEIIEKGIFEKINIQSINFQKSNKFNQLTPYEIEIGAIPLLSPILFQLQSLKLIQTSVFTSYFTVEILNTIQEPKTRTIYDFQNIQIDDNTEKSNQYENMILNNFVENENLSFNTFSRNSLTDNWILNKKLIGNRIPNLKKYVFYDPYYSDTKTIFNYNNNNSIRINQKVIMGYTKVQKIFLITQATEKYFIVYGDNLQTVFIQDSTGITQDTEFIAFQQNILDITGVQQGIFIAHKNTLSYLQALGTGDGIQLSTTNYKLDQQDTMIGVYTTVYVSNGFITYIYNNTIKKYPVPINSNIVSAVQRDTYYLLQDSQNRILIFNPIDGTLSILSLSEIKDFYIEYSLIKEKETNQIYGIKNTGNPKYEMEFSNNTLITLLEISSYNNIIKAIVKDIEIKPVLHYNKYKINVNMAIQKNNPIFLEFKDKINDDIVLGVK